MKINFARRKKVRDYTKDTYAIDGAATEKALPVSFILTSIKSKKKIDKFRAFSNGKITNN
jgi:hypothetical protein